MKILKVLKVVDTREYEEIGDRFVPIPGTGNMNDCSRCGRSHEIHWTVALEGGTDAVMGSSCAKSEATLDEKLIRTMESAAKRAAALRREIAVLEPRIETLLGAIAQVAALPLPEVVFGHHVTASGEKIPTVRMGDSGDVWIQFDGYTMERAAFLANTWRGKRVAELLPGEKPVYMLKEALRIAEKALFMAETRMGKALAPEKVSY